MNALQYFIVLHFQRFSEHVLQSTTQQFLVQKSVTNMTQIFYTRNMHSILLQNIHIKMEYHTQKMINLKTPTFRLNSPIQKSSLVGFMDVW